MSELNDQVPTREKVLVIGAGPAGLAAAAALQALEVPFDLVDRAPHVGGIWDPEREDSPVWPSLEMVSSREYTQYEDLLWPVSYPDFLDPAQMAKYLRAYASRHHLGERFRPGVAVRTAHPFEEGVWQVEFSTGEITVYGGVISAHGIAERPHRPEWAEQIGEGTRVIHSSEWEGPDGLEGSGCSWSAPASPPRTSRWTPRAAPWTCAGRCAPATGWCRAPSPAPPATSPPPTSRPCWAP